MRPPICVLCGEAASADGLVSFAADTDSEDWYARANAEPGFVGHPPDLEWFCDDHLSAARELAHLERSAAIAALRSQ